MLPRMARRGSMAQHKGGEGIENGRGRRDSFSPCVRPDHRAGSKAKGERANRLLGAREAARSHLSVNAFAHTWPRHPWPPMLPIDPRTATMDLGSAPALVKHANTNAHIPTTARADGKGNKGAC